MTIESGASPRPAKTPARPRDFSHSHNNKHYYRCFQNYYHALKYLQPFPSYLWGVGPSISHWQLRDLVQVDLNSGVLYHTRDDAVRGVDVDLGMLFSTATLDYSPRCFHQNGGYIAAGGVVTLLSRMLAMDVPLLAAPHAAGRPNKPLKGLFLFALPALEQPLTFRLGEMINNAVHMHTPSENQFNAFVCNNDLHLYVVEMAEGRSEVVSKLTCETSTSLNNVCRAPDNSAAAGLLAVTGDLSLIFLLDPKAASANVRTIRTGHNPGFGISYHSGGNIFATAFEDGACVLYDVRNIVDDRPLFEIKSTRPGHQTGAFRCCRFLPSQMCDLLVVLEHVGRVHLVDMRTLHESSDHQVAVFPHALDQFAESKSHHQKATQKMHQSSGAGADDSEPRTMKKSYRGTANTLKTAEDHADILHHPRLRIYSDESDDIQFSAPLVYDYDYLTNDNPKLFKNYTYQAPPDGVNSFSYLPPPRLNYPQWKSETAARGSLECPSLGGRQSISYAPTDISNVAQTPATSPSTENAPFASFYCQDSYQLALKHVHGEMELAGVDWYGSQLFIGGEDGGVINWDVNVMARRSCGSYSFV